uniref:carbonic anhydrase n=1 Tax=Alexandrium monilatum TaxID=311494 RepID=A0A7S4T248_9DINO
MRQDKTALLVDAAGAVLHADVAGYQDLMFDKRRDEVVEETDVTGADVLFHRLRYKPVQNRTIRNNGHAVQADGGFGSFILLDGEYQAKQFRFHVPSEHSVGGQHAAAEPRSVCCSSCDGRAQCAADMPPMQYNAPSAKRHSQLRFVMKAVDRNAFSDLYSGDFYHYLGSLTTPPCTEGVHWYVAKKYAPITDAMLDDFKKNVLTAGKWNNRPVKTCT